jgi:hypothetical protein
MAYLRIALIVASIVAATAAPADISECAKRAEDAVLAIAPPGTPKNLKPGVTSERYADVLTRVFTSLLTECARQACKSDVRECIKVRDYEEAEARWRKKITEPE